jgi:WD40 repeat protein
MSQFEQGAVRGVSATLDETSKLDRGLEFDYAHHLVNGRSRRLEGYTSKDLVNSIAFVPGRDQLIATADDSTVRIWDTATGRQIQSLSTPGVRVNWNFMNPLKAASPSGTAFATADSKGRVCVWDLIEGVKRLDLKAPSGVIAVAFSGDGKRLGTITKDARFVMWDSQTGESIVGTTLAIDSYLPIRKGSLFLNYNGTAGVLQKDSPGGLVCAFQAAGGEVPFSLDQSVRDVAFSSDGERIAVSSGKTVKLLDANGHVVHVFPPDKWGRRVHFLAGDRQLAAFTSDSAVIWDVATREKLKGFDFGEGNGTPFLDMHIDGDMLQLRGYRNGQLETWSLADGKCLRRVPIPESLIRELGYPVAGPDLNRVGLFRNKELKIVDIPSQTVVLSEYPHLEQVIHEQGKSRYGRVAVRPDGSMFATGGDVLRIWAVGETSPVHVLQIRPWESSVHDVAFEPGGNWLAVLSSRTLAIVEPDSGRVLRRFDAAASVFSRLEIHPSGEAIVLTERGNGNDAEGIKVLCVVDVKTGKELVKVGHPDQRGFWDLAIHPSGDIVATAGREETVRLWDTRTLEPRGSIQFEAVSIQSLEFSGDGKTLVAVGSDQSIHVYDMAKKKVMQTLHSPGGDVWDVAAQGSEWIATSGESGDLRLWDLTEGEPGFAPIEGFPNGVQAVQLLGAQPIVIDEDGEVSVRLADGRWQALAHSDASQSVTQLAVSNETRRLAVGDRQGSVAIWEPSPLGEPVASKAQWMRRLHERSVRFLQFTVDGRRLISVDEENVLIISNTVSGEVLHSINLPMRPADLSCHPTLPSIAVLHENGALATWNTASGQLERESSRPLAGGTCLAFNEEGTRLFISGDDTDMMMVDPWSLEMLDAIKRENDPKRICQCTANLDGGSHVTVWESNLGVPLLTIKLAAKRPQHLAVADGRVLIAGEDGAWVWQAP